MQPNLLHRLKSGCFLLIAVAFGFLSLLVVIGMAIGPSQKSNSNEALEEEVIVHEEANETITESAAPANVAEKAVDSMEAIETVNISEQTEEHKPKEPQTVFNTPEQLSFKTYKVVNVIDGDTIDVLIDGTVERIRMIGIDTPETVDPRKPVQCFGVEASNRTKSVLSGSTVTLEADASQGERDKYGRLLRYVILSDGTNFNLSTVLDGYAHEYTFDSAYTYQSLFKAAENEARLNERGLWAPDACFTESEPTVTVTDDVSNCQIKGNISSDKEKIYHLPGCGSYNRTVITESSGERWFCSESEAVAAGWRKALNCQ